MSSLVLNESTSDRRTDKDRQRHDSAEGAYPRAQLVHRADLASGCRHDGYEDARCEPIQAGKGDNKRWRSGREPHGKAEEAGQDEHRV